MAIPRRIRLDLMTPPEVAIRTAMAAVEKMSADVRLTNAGLKLSEALDLVSAYVDEQVRDSALDSEAGLSWNGWRKVAEEYAAERRGESK